MRAKDGLTEDSKEGEQREREETAVLFLSFLSLSLASNAVQ